MNHKVIYLTTIIVTLMFLFTLNEKPEATGYATFATSSEVYAVLGTLSTDNSLKLLADGSQICIVVEITNETTYYYELTKLGESVIVAEKYCADPFLDNVIVKFNSYDDLLAFNADPIEFIKTRKNTGYYLFPSNYVASGGEVDCTETFQQNYCVPFYYYMTKSEISDINLECCADYELTTDEQARIRELKEGIEEVRESPFAFLTSTTGIIIIIGVVLFIIVITALIMVKPKNPLTDYVAQVRQQGYSDEDIRRALLDSGWDEKTIDDALKAKH